MLAHRRKSLLGCCALFALVAIGAGLLAIQFGYWWDETHPHKPMRPTWDGLLLAFLPWLLGVIWVVVGVLTAAAAVIGWVIWKFRDNRPSS
ncbi:MAG: hypothetical protein KDA75_12035 [Planctomycetaceae bacterium]|nr:hypothetical protein [Planctomycetaceae bacterium]